MRWRQWNEIRWVSIYKRWAVGKMWQRNGVAEAQLLLPGQPQTDRPVVLSDTAGHRALVYETYHHTTADWNELVWIDSSRTPLMMSTYYLLTMPMSVKWTWSWDGWRRAKERHSPVHRNKFITTISSCTRKVFPVSSSIQWRSRVTNSSYEVPVTRVKYRNFKEMSASVAM